MPCMFPSRKARINYLIKISPLHTNYAEKSKQRKNHNGISGVATREELWRIVGLNMTINKIKSSIKW